MHPVWPWLGLAAIVLRWNSLGWSCFIWIHKSCWRMLPWCRFFLRRHGQAVWLLHWRRFQACSQKAQNFGIQNFTCLSLVALKHVPFFKSWKSANGHGYGNGLASLVFWSFLGWDEVWPWQQVGTGKKSTTWSSCISWIFTDLQEKYPMLAADVSILLGFKTLIYLIV